MDQHVSLLCRSVFQFQELHRIGHLRHHLSVEAMKRLVLFFILSKSRLGYRNSHCWQVSVITGQIACRKYKIMLCVVFLTGRDETVHPIDCKVKSKVHQLRSQPVEGCY